MFENALMEGKAKTRRGWSVVASFGLQVCGVGVALLIPLANPELLPAALQPKVWLVPPPPAPPPAPQAPATPTATRKAPRLLTSAGLVLPTVIPEKVAVIVDPAELPPPGNYVPGSIGSGNGPGLPDGMIVPTVAGPTVAPPPPAKKPEAQEQKITRIRVGTGVQEAMLVNRVIPPYPPLARTARIEGKVIFTAVIGRDGSIQNLQLVGGHPLLVEAAKSAVSQWRYRPTLLSGEPVEVMTTIEVNFKLTQ